MGELKVERKFSDDKVIIKILPDTGDEITLNKENLTATFNSKLVKEIVVTVQGVPEHCSVSTATLPSGSDLFLKSIEGATANPIIINHERLYISHPPSNWEFTITIPERNEDPDPVTIGDNPPL